jgi:hypothetical protein
MAINKFTYEEVRIGGLKRSGGLAGAEASSFDSREVRYSKGETTKCGN